MSLCYIQLLGDFQLCYGDQVVTTINQPRLQSLLAYLLLHRHAPQARHHLAFTFWPDVQEAQARNNLRQMLHQLRHALPNATHFLRTDANTVQWVADGPFRLDVADFEAAVRQAAHHERNADGVAATHALQTALAFYQGDLLPSCYDDWIMAERDRLRQQTQHLCRQLSQRLEAERAYTAALAVAQRLQQLDPLDETTYVRLMRLHALNQDRASAVRVYHECITILQRELGVEPGDELQASYKRLRQLAHQPTMLEPQAAPHASLLPLIGRQPEWERLRTCWQAAARGQPALALITGEAGIGKTRLAEELWAWAARQGVTCARTRAYAAEGRLSYAPLIEWLRTPPLMATLARLDPVWRSELARLLPELLTQQPALPSPGPLTEYWQRQRFFEALARGLLAGQAPLLLLIDDSQWCDQETLEWLHFLLRFDAKARLLVVGTVRSEELPANPALLTLVRALQGGRQLHEFALPPLDAAEVDKLATTISTRELAVAETMHLFRESEGNPLFVVELVRAGGPLEHQAPTHWSAFTPAPHAMDAPAALPPNLYAVIAGRLHQLSAVARELIGVAATIGRAFTLGVLMQACDQDEATLINALDELWQRRIIREQGIHTYDFSHDKLRDVAYRETSPMHRRRLHRRVAAALESVYTDDLEPVSGQLAAHYEQAGLPLRAVAYYQRAGAVAQRVYANAEAIQLYHKGVALLATVPENPERWRQELALQNALVAPLATNAGYGAPALIATCQRARTLAGQLGMAPDPAVLRALAIGSVGRCWYREAQDLGEQLLALAERAQDAILYTEAYYVLGVTSFYLGEFQRARQQLTQALAHYEPANSTIHIARYAQDPKVICLCRLALTLWYLGYSAQAQQTTADAWAFAQQLAHPFSLVYCLYWNAMVQQHCGQLTTMRARIENGTELIRTHQLGTFAHWMASLHGWALAEQGDVAAGMAQLRTSIEQARGAGIQNLECFNLGLLAERAGQQGDFADAAHLLDEALVWMATTGEAWRKAEVYSCQGELLVQQFGVTGESEDALRQAIALAQQQEAKALELRAALSLARLWHSAGRDTEARQLLTPIYGWFTEGFDTPDLREAGVLLNLVSHAA